MYMTLNKVWRVIDASKPKDAKGDFVRTEIPVGRHEIERIRSPFPEDNQNWLVLKGTQIGMSEVAWGDWKDEKWGEYQVIIEE